MILRIYFFNIIFYLSILFFGIVFLPCLVSRKYTRKVVKAWAKIVIFSLKRILDIKVSFYNNFINKKDGFLIAANHQSAFDTVFFLAAFDNTIYIIKEELKFIPIYGWYAKRLENIFVDRKKKIESIKKLSKDIKYLINKGFKIIIFPEGTRQPEGQIGDIKPGVFLLQRNLKESIYPVYISSGETWPKNSFKMKKKNILIKALDPIPYGLDKKKFKTTLKQALEKNIKNGPILYD